MAIFDLLNPNVDKFIHFPNFYQNYDLTLITRLTLITGCWAGSRTSALTPNGTERSTVPSRDRRFTACWPTPSRSLSYSWLNIWWCSSWAYRRDSGSGLPRLWPPGPISIVAFSAWNLKSTSRCLRPCKRNNSSAAVWFYLFYFFFISFYVSQSNCSLLLTSQSQSNVLTLCLLYRWLFGFSLQVNSCKYNLKRI